MDTMDEVLIPTIYGSRTGFLIVSSCNLTYENVMNIGIITKNTK